MSTVLILLDTFDDVHYQPLVSILVDAKMPSFRMELVQAFSSAIIVVKVEKMPHTTQPSLPSGTHGSICHSDSFVTHISKYVKPQDSNQAESSL